MNIRVFLVDDHQLLLDSLTLLLDGVKNIKVVGSSKDWDESRQGIRTALPDIVIMDINMPGISGIEATRHLLAAHPDMGVIALTAHSSKHHVLEMLAAGASAYVLKEDAGEELVRAITLVASGHKYLCPAVADTVVNNITHHKTESVNELGQREREVLYLLANGLTSSEIAARMNISHFTVDVHRRNIMSKLDMHSIAELTRYAVKEGIIPLQ